VCWATHHGVCGGCWNESWLSGNALFKPVPRC
jgi:hypothetical protein